MFDDQVIAPPRQFPCSQCGANLVFAPGEQSLKCPYCGAINEIEQAEETVEELDFHEHLQQLSENEESIDTQLVKCQACAAESNFPPGRVADRCPFCGTPIVTQAHTRRMIKPRGILPFRITQEASQKAFMRWIERLWFAPSRLRREAQRGRITGIYEPAWTYDCRTITHYTGQRGEDYTTTVGVGKNRRTVRRTRWYPASGVVSNTFDDVLVLSSNTLPPRLRDKLAPWDLKSVVPYDDRYLAGFVAEAYQVDLEQGFYIAQQRMRPAIEMTVRRDIGGDRQRIDHMNIDWRNITFKHILLPVWLSAYQFNGRTFRFVVNARTGEVTGERPYSAWKIGLLVTLILIALVLVWVMLQG
jgi:LSD1 subclass zinc finger protein